MRDTSVYEKAIPSVLNASSALLLSLPILYFFGTSVVWKLSTILIFYILQVIDTHEHKEFRCFGMRIFGTHWEKEYSRLQRNTYAILYTCSFATLFFSVLFPFDLFLVNILMLQLPTILITGTTLHGILSGNMRTKRG
jgi:hypothetical protein